MSKILTKYDRGIVGAKVALHDEFVLYFVLCQKLLLIFAYLRFCFVYFDFLGNA